MYHDKSCILSCSIIIIKKNNQLEKQQTFYSAYSFFFSFCEDIFSHFLVSVSQNKINRSAERGERGCNMAQKYLIFFFPIILFKHS